jgi:hypothetical protein
MASLISRERRQKKNLLSWKERRTAKRKKVVKKDTAHKSGFEETSD